jgi:hypothetical protein
MQKTNPAFGKNANQGDLFMAKINKPKSVKKNLAVDNGNREAINEKVRKDHAKKQNLFENRPVFKVKDQSGGSIKKKGKSK